MSCGKICYNNANSFVCTREIYLIILFFCERICINIINNWKILDLAILCSNCCHPIVTGQVKIIISSSSSIDTKFL